MALFDIFKGLTSANWRELRETFQVKEASKGLSSEDFTKEYKAKLDKGFEVPEGYVVLHKDDLPKPFEIPEGHTFLSEKQAEKLEWLSNYEIPKGYSLLSEEQAKKLNELSNYTPPRDYTAKYVLVKQDGKSIPMEFEVFKSQPKTLPENQINIIL